MNDQKSTIEYWDELNEAVERVKDEFIKSFIPAVIAVRNMMDNFVLALNQQDRKRIRRLRYERRYRRRGERMRRRK